MNRAILVSPLIAALGLAANVAQAQNSSLHHAQAGALLAYASADVTIVHGAVTSRQFDLSLTESLVNELVRTLRDAKRSTDKAADLLDEKQENLRPDLEKVRTVLVRAEKECAKLKNAIETEVKPYIEASLEEESDELAAPTGAKPEVTEPRWDAIKTTIGWLSVDVAEAQKLHAAVGKKLKGPKPTAPKKPKGKRG